MHVRVLGQKILHEFVSSIIEGHDPICFDNRTAAKHFAIKNFIGVYASQGVAYEALRDTAFQCDPLSGHG